MSSVQSLNTRVASVPEDEAVEARLRREAEAERARAVQLDRTLLWIGRIGLIVAILVSWELASGTLMNARYVSKPSEIGVLLYRWFFETREVYPHLLKTLTEVLLGYGLGVALGLTAAVVLTQFPRAYRVVQPFVVAFYGIPKVALAPILVMWLGLDITPKVVIATIIVFFVIFMNSVAGLSSVRPELVDIARVMGASRWQILRTIMLPAAAPYILTAMRITIPDAVVGALVGEFIAGNLGMGNLIRRSSSQLVTAGVFGGIFVLAMIVILMRVALTPLERKLLGWREK